jgi:hypothetical protein
MFNPVHALAVHIYLVHDYAGVSGTHYNKRTKAYQRVVYDGNTIILLRFDCLG